MIGFLEDLVGADAGGLDRGVAGVVQRGGVDVHAADLAVADLHRIDLPHAVGDELGRVAGMLAEDEDQSACGPALQGLDLGADLRLRPACGGPPPRLERRKAQYRQSLVHSLPTYSGAKSTMRLP